MNGVPDVENQIFDECKDAVIAVDPGVLCKGLAEVRPAKFPFLSLYEASNTPYIRSHDSSSGEHHAVLQYVSDVFTNDAAGRKDRCKTIMAAVCAYFHSLGFQRTFCQPTPNPADPTIYRMTARFEAVLDTRNKLYMR